MLNMKIANRFLKHLTYAWKRHGWRLFGPLLWHNIVYQIDRLRGRRGSPEITELDRKLGIDTYNIEATALMEINGDNLVRGYRYQPVTETAFRASIEDLQIDISRYTFIDYGSGKGRALLLATEFPFRRIIGIEYARELHNIAVTNLIRAKTHLPRTNRVQCIWEDATQYEPPMEPLVCFLYNPFNANVIERLLNKLSNSLVASPRDIVITYVNPVHRDAIDNHPDITLLREGTSTTIYRLNLPKISDRRSTSP